MRLLVAGYGYVGEQIAARFEGEALGVRRTPTQGAIRADLLDAEGLRAALPGRFDALVYAVSAGERSEEAYRRAYVEGLRSTLHALRDHPLRRIVFVSSTAVYGDAEGWVDEDTVCEPSAFNGEVMREAEEVAIAAGGTALRLGGIYGPGRTYLLRSVEAGKPSSNKYRNRIHRDDCTGAALHILQMQDPAPIYVGVDDAPAPLSEVTAFLADQLGVPHPPVEESEPRGKRCRNDALKSTGWTLTYPTYREGYPPVIADHLSSRP